MPGYDARAIANEFISLARRDGYFLTNMQLQKLSYIAHGWGLALLHAPLIRDVPQAWRYGPVYPELYGVLRRYGPSNVSELIREGDADIRAFISSAPDARGEVVHTPLTNDEENLLEAVWRNYRQYSAFRLSEMTHRPNTPWSEIYAGGTGDHAPIPNDLIQRHYEEMIQRHYGEMAKKRETQQRSNTSKKESTSGNGRREISKEKKVR